MARDTNFYYSFLVLPRARREAIVAVWDVCRAIDDVADESGLAPDAQRRLLDEWRAEVARVFEGGAPRTRQGQALQAKLTQFSLPRPAFDDLIEGVQMDVDGRVYDTFEELEVYCYHVASTVGLMCIEIFGCQHPRARDYAVTLGKALQLTNILRDVGTDARSGRVYLPRHELRRAGCSFDDLTHPAPSPALVTVLRALATRAHDFYRVARQLRPAQDRRRLVAADIMANIYRALLCDIERGAFPVLGAPLRLTRARKARVAAATWLATMLSWSRSEAV